MRKFRTPAPRVDAANHEPAAEQAGAIVPWQPPAAEPPRPEPERRSRSRERVSPDDSVVPGVWDAPVASLGKPPKGQRGWSKPLVEAALADLGLGDAELVPRGGHWHFASRPNGLSLNVYGSTGVLLVQGRLCTGWDEKFRVWKSSRAAPEGARGR